MLLGIGAFWNQVFPPSAKLHILLVQEAEIFLWVVYPSICYNNMILLCDVSFISEIKFVLIAFQEVQSLLQLQDYVSWFAVPGASMYFLNRSACAMR